MKIFSSRTCHYSVVFVLTALFLMLYASGCKRASLIEPITEGELASLIEVGISKEQVLDIFGRPTETRTNGHIQAFVYYFTAVPVTGEVEMSGFQVFFEDNRVAIWAPTYMRVE